VTVGLPFSADQFFGVFADYNRTFWPIAALLWLAATAMLVMAWRDPARWSRGLTYLLAVVWAWSAIAYHAWLFTQINPAAWLFAVLFACEAILLFRAAARGRLEYSARDGATGRLGVALAAYALAYPFLSMALGHAYPPTPTFGVPCPTDLLTIGVLLVARGRVPPLLAVIPALWAFVGGSAAVLLDVATDYVLLAAGVLLVFVLVVQRTGRTS